MTEKVKEKVAGVLGDFSSLDSAKALFAELNYDIARDTLPRQKWGKIATEALAEDPQIIATHGDFRIIYGRLARDRLLITPERAVVNTLLREHPYALFLFSTEDQRLWHFVNVKLASGEEDDERNKDTKKRRLFRRITVREKEQRLWTAVGRISMLDLALIQPELFGPIPPLTVQSQHDTAFDVEAVTKEFYDAYEGVFNTFWKDLEEQTRDRRWAHDYSLQFLNRLMFLYFVQRKGWLAEDSEFLETFWKTYSKSNQPKNTFFDKWLKVLFFEAFNNQKNLLNTNQRAYLPDEIRKALWEAPYLNGGLFKKNKLDEPVVDFQVSDRQFGRIFNLFQRYNFTITEDSPLDQEVAVDPEMIGKVYESLVNLTEAGMEQKAAGIFYTPRTEIDLMCRLSLVDNLTNHLGEEHKNLLYEVVFSLDHEDKEEADRALAEAGLWPEVEKRLNEITVLDPACGSGSFLVGMLYILNDLLERAETQRSEHTSSYERRKQIIGQSLYGVDVMDWACHVAELRLWLALIVDAEFGKEELMIRKEPLLPHFSFKVRCGDSLVQEIGGVDMAHRRGVMEIPKPIKDRLRKLQNAKVAFYSNQSGDTETKIKDEEVRVFRDLLEFRVKDLKEEAKKLMRLQAVQADRQMTLDGSYESATKQLMLERERREQKIKELMEGAESIEKLRDAIRRPGDVLFVWDIAFAEIMESDEGGFDVVIGNPPYVRQEKIADPKLPQEKVTVQNKKEYKAKLARSVYKEYQRFFGYSSKAGVDKVAHKIDAKSDLYIYYYFHGLSLLNDKGSFSFITSNSWLDVGYGRDLQEFLLKRCHTKLVIDNKAKRSFKSADVNTVIVLFGAPVDPKTGDEVSLKKTAKFVMFYVPFEEVLHPVVFEEIEEFSKKTTRPEYRVFPVKQAALLADGCEIPKEAEKKKSRGPLIKTAKYVGNKWGGKYLRAPDIYWTILEKGKDKLVRLGDIAEVRRGFTTGANEFFYLNDEKIKEWGIEKEFLKPVIKSPREFNRIMIEKQDLSQKVFICRKDKVELKGTAALEYIKWGEQSRKDENGNEIGQFHKRPTCANRVRWWELGILTSPFIERSTFNRNFDFLFNPNKLIIDKVMYGVDLTTDVEVYKLGVSLNCFISALFIETYGSKGLGEGALFITVEDSNQNILICDPRTLSTRAKETFEYLKSCPLLPVKEQIEDKIRREANNAIFDILGLTQGEREAVYEAVIDLVESRLKKAESLRE